MHEPDAPYAVDLKIEEPKLEAERRFIVAERRYVHQQLAKATGESWTTWRPITVSALGLFRKTDWERYDRALVKYEHELDRYEQEMADGLLPFKVYVSNLGTQADTAVQVTVKVEHGAIHEAKKAPSRPDRLDATPSAVSLQRPRLALWRGFVRRKVRIGRHEMAAEFSRLGAGESAELVRQTLHLAASEATRMRFVIHSKLTPETSGEVGLVDA